MVDVLQLFFDDLRVDLRGGNICMTQHFLNGAQVRTVLQQMHRKRMS